VVIIKRLIIFTLFWQFYIIAMGRPRRRCVDNIKMDLREIGWDGTDWIHLAQDRDQWRALGEHGNEPPGSIKCWEVLEQLHNWRLLRKGSDP
jgi:hypothetical protein